MKRAIAESSQQQQRNDDDSSERPSSLVNLSSNRNVVTLQFTPACPVIQEANASTASSLSKQQAETSFINIDQPKSLIVAEKCLAHARGDAV